MPALIFDCDGVLADTERFGHLPAFNQMFEEFGVPVHWSDADYAEAAHRRRQGADGDPADPRLRRRERAARRRRGAAGAGRPVAPPQDRHLHRPGRLGRPAGSARHPRASPTKRTPRAGSSPSPRRRPSHPCAPCSTTRSARRLATRFAVFAGDVVAHKKPAPDIYQLALNELAPIPTRRSSSRTAATGCWPRSPPASHCVVTASSYTDDEDFTGAALVVSSLGDPGEPARVIADPLGCTPGPQLGLADLERILDLADPPPARRTS